MSVTGPTYVPPVQLGPAHATAPRDQQQKREQPKRKKRDEAEHDQVELSNLTPEEMGTVPPAPIIPARTTPIAPIAERHIDLQG